MLRAVFQTMVATALGLSLAAGSPVAAKSKPIYGMQGTNGRTPGVFVTPYPGDDYYVQAVSDAMVVDEREVRALDDQILARMAQFALENGRDYFSIDPIRSDTTAGRITRVAGRAGTTQYACSRNSAGAPICSPAGTIGGSIGYTVQEDDWFNRTTIASIWTTDEKRAIDAGRLKGPPSSASALMDAEQIYIEKMQVAVGRWPSVPDILEKRAQRFEERGRDGDAEARIIASQTWLRLGTWYERLNRPQEAAAAGLAGGRSAVGTARRRVSGSFAMAAVSSAGDQGISESGGVAFH